MNWSSDRAPERPERETPVVRFIVLIALILTLGGCAVRREAINADRPARVIYLSGVAGPDWFDRRFVSAQGADGLEAEIEIFNWRPDRWPLAALRNQARNREVAQRIAQRLVDLRTAHGDQPLHLIGVSGGAGVGVWALEALPDDVQVDHVILLAPAVSNDYDLSRALRHVKGRMYAFSSLNDWRILGIGSFLFGTVDGQYEWAAGLTGFHRPKTADAGEYDKLDRRRYDPSWSWRYGYLGDHASILATRFASGYLSPLLAGKGAAPR